MIASKSKAYVTVAIVLVNLFCLLPVLDSPYLGDDSWCESTTPGVLSLTSASLSTVCLETILDFMKDGRWHPLVVYYYPVFSGLDRWSYKIVVMAFILLNVIAFGYFVRIITESDFAAGMGMLLLPLFFQLRAYHDPILSYYFLMQLELLLLLISLVLLHYYLRVGKRLYLVAGVVAYTTVLLIYEAFYGFWLAHLAVTLSHLGRNSWKRVVKVTLPFAAVAAVNIVFTASLRMFFEPHYKGTTLSLDAGRWLATAAKQVVAAVPLSYPIAEGSFGSIFGFTETYFGPDVFLLCAMWLLLFFLLWDQGADDCNLPRGNRVTLSAIGLVFLIMPAPVIALSVKYQTELRWGLGYLPAYVSAFGLVMLTVPVLAAVRAAAVRWGVVTTRLAVVTCALLGTVVCGLVYAGNRTVILQYNYAEHYPRRLVERALHAGLMKPVPEQSCLLVGPPFRSWDSPAFYRMHSGLSLQVVRGGDFEMDSRLGIVPFDEAFAEYKVPGSQHLYDVGPLSTSMKRFQGYELLFNGSHGPALRPRAAWSDIPLHGETYYLDYQTGSQDSGYAILARAARLKSSHADPCRVAADSLRIYLEKPLGSVSSGVVVTGKWIDGETMSSGEAFRFTGKELTTVRDESTWKIVEVPAAGMKGLIDPASVLAAFTVGHE